MKKTSVILILYVMLHALCGCGTNDRKIDEVKRCSIEDAYDIENLYEENYDNIEIPPDLLVHKSTNLQQGEYQIVNLQEKNEEIYETLFKNDIGQKKYSSQYITNDLSSYPIGPYYDDGEQYVSLGCTGFYSKMDNQVLSLFGDGTNMKIEKSYNLYDDKIESLNIELPDGKISIKDLKSKLQKEIDKNFEARGIANEVQLSPKMAYLVQDKNSGQKYIHISIQQFQNNVGVVDIIDSAAGKPDYAEIMGGQAIMTSVKDFSSIILFDYGMLEKTKTNNDITEIISLSDAIKRASKKITDRLHYEVQYVAIEYMMKYQYNLQEKEPEKYKGEFLHRKNAPWASTCSYDVFSAKPYWAIYLDVEYKKEVVAYVDCQTGEVRFVNNRK